MTTRLFQLWFLLLLVGCGGMGRGDAGNASRFGDILAVCDVDKGHAEAAAKQFTKDGKVPTQYSDFRKMLEREDIHVVVNGTPDHWHTLVNLGATLAGKDVYGEKPLTLSVDEGKRLVKAVQKRKTVLQTGTQQRSHERFRLACELVRNGRLGKLKEITVWLPAGLREGPFKPEAVPSGLDWAYWLGQAPWAEYTPKRCHVFFRYWYDYSGGTITDWGAHHNDIALWATGMPGPGSASFTKPYPSTLRSSEKAQQQIVMATLPWKRKPSPLKRSPWPWRQRTRTGLSSFKWND